MISSSLMIFRQSKLSCFISFEFQRYYLFFGGTLVNFLVVKMMMMKCHTNTVASWICTALYFLCLAHLILTLNLTLALNLNSGVMFSVLFSEPLAWRDMNGGLHPVETTGLDFDYERGIKLNPRPRPRPRPCLHPCCLTHQPRTRTQPFRHASAHFPRVSPAYSAPLQLRHYGTTALDGNNVYCSQVVIPRDQIFTNAVRMWQSLTSRSQLLFQFGLRNFKYQVSS